MIIRSILQHYRTQHRHTPHHYGLLVYIIIVLVELYRYLKASIEEGTQRRGEGVSGIQIDAFGTPCIDGMNGLYLFPWQHYTIASCHGGELECAEWPVTGTGL